MKKEVRDLINLKNALKSTGPRTTPGKQRASMNALVHGLTGNRLLLQTHEHEAYQRLSEELNKDLKPGAELERQLVQKIIDCHTRLNRIAALDGNILNFGLTQNETDAGHDDAIESITAQCRSWIENADSFEKLGRYESRISRQLLQYTRELERLQDIRHQQERIAALEAREAAQRAEREQAAREEAQREREEEEEAAAAAEALRESARQTEETEPDNPESASFRKPTPIDAKRTTKRGEPGDSRRPAA